MLIIYEVIVRWDNRKKAKAYGGEIIDGIEDAEDQLDITDREKKTFKYIY
jgi:hypothetical protein